MKKTDFLIAVLFLLVISFSFLIVSSNKVIGQTSSGSSSSSGSLSCNSDNDCPSGICPNQTTYQKFSCLNNQCHELNFFADPCLFQGSSSSSGGTQITLNKNFTGVWKARVKRIVTTPSSSSSGSNCLVCIQVVPDCEPGQTLVPQSCNECAHCINNTSSGGGISRKSFFHLSNEHFGSNIVTFKLCVRNGKLEGTIQQGGIFLNGMITSQNIISENTVEITAESKNDKTAKIILMLTGNRQFTGTFSDGHTFEAKKLNPLNSCMATSNKP